MAVLALATAAYTWVVSVVIDEAQKLGGNSGIETLKKYARTILPILIGMTTLSGIANYCQTVLANKMALNAIAKMQNQMFEASHRSDYASFSQEPTGIRLSKFVSDVSVLSVSLVRVLSKLVRDLLTVIFTIAAILWQNWILSLSMGVFVLAILPLIAISRKMRGSAHEVQEHNGVITAELKESFGGAKMIKTYGLENREKTRLSKTFDTRIRLYLKMIMQQARVDPILEVLGGLAIAAIVILGVYLVDIGRATPGSIAAVLTGVMILAPKLRALGALNNVVQEGLSSLHRIFDVIDEEPTVTECENAKVLENAKGHLLFKDVSFNYDDGTLALSNFSLEAKPGEMIALVGESGGGKSTVINLIPRLYDVTEGAIAIDGTDIRNLTLESLRRNIALVSQDVTLFNDTIAENIRMGRLEASQEDIKQAAKHAAAYEFIMALPDGFETVIGEDGDTLSGGQKQRLAIARAILRDAPILLLDEATSALDSESESKVQKALDTLRKGRTQIIIAHRLSTIREADRIYVLKKGKVVETGTHASLSKKRGGIYAKLKNIQAN